MKDKALIGLLDWPVESWYSAMDSGFKLAVKTMFAERAATYAEVYAYAEHFFTLKLMSWVQGESGTVADLLANPSKEMSLAMSKNLVQLPAKEAVEKVKTFFKNKKIPTINPKVYNKIMANSLTDAKVSLEKMTEHAQKSILDALEGGSTPAQARKAIQDMGASRGYAENVYRTNTHKAYNDATYQRAMDSGYADGFKYMAIGDARTRANHNACDRLEQPIDSKYWDYVYPPLGFNCRCRVVVITAGLLEPNIPSGLSLPATKKSGSKGFADPDTFGSRPAYVK